MLVLTRVVALVALTFLAPSIALPAQSGGSKTTSASEQQKARMLKAGDQLQEAAIAYRKALELQPKWADGWWEFATVEFDLEHYRASREALAHFLVLSPKNGSAWALKGLSEYELGMTKAALADLHQSDSFVVTDENNLKENAELHELLLDSATGHFQDAFKIVEQLCAQSPAFPLVIATGITALRIASMPSAIPQTQRDLVSRTGLAVCDAAGSRTQRAATEFADLLSRYPSMPQLHYLYGCFLIKDHPDEGLAQLLAELSITPAHQEAMTEVALEYLRRGDDQKALPYAEQAVTISPESEKAQLAIGRVMVDQNRVASGVVHLKREVALSPSDRSALLALASAYSAQGNDREAQRIRLKLQR